MTKKELKELKGVVSDLLDRLSGKRRLKTGWIIELEEDLKCLSGLDIEQELFNNVANEIQTQIDREILEGLNLPNEKK